MNFLDQFHFKTLKYDLANKFHYNKTFELPIIKKVILNFGCKTANIRNLSANLLALELISDQKCKLTLAKKSTIKLKIRKGTPVGCKVTLRKAVLFNFLSRTLHEILPNIKIFERLILSRNIKKNAFSYEIPETFNFTGLEKNYNLFSNLPKLRITIITSSNRKEELIFILKSLQLPF